MSQKVYVAGPLFNTHERMYLEQITAALEAEGFETFLPHRDAGILGDLSDIRERERLFREVDTLNALGSGGALEVYPLPLKPFLYGLSSLAG